jgi:hypothetical protein
MRGTVRHLDSDRVVIDTDSGLVRELSSAYAAEHLEHAYALTGHGMQGGTVEAATVVATPHDLTAGWSYTALSRARGHTRLLIYEDSYAEERSEFAPTDQTPATNRDELLARVSRRMLERDDEDLAIEQLPGAGRADDADVDRATSSPGESRQEQAAARAQLIPAIASAERLREVRDRIQQLRLARELGYPSEVRAEREGLQRALTQLTREHTEIRDELAEREVHAPGAWAARTFGERPDEPRRLKDWEYGVRQVARYRLQYSITDPEELLGQQPETPEQRRHWRQTRNALNHSAERLSRETCNDLNLSIDPVE